MQGYQKKGDGHPGKEIYINTYRQGGITLYWLTAKMQ